MIRLRMMALVLGVLCLASQVQARVTAHLDRTRIADGDTVLLQIESDGQTGGRPDTTPLKKDFDVLGVSNGSRVSIVNGHMDARATWTLTLSPRHTGRLRIPPLSVGGEQTPALELEVARAPVADQASGSPVFIETEVQPASPYVRGQLIYTVKVLHRIPLGKGTLSDPELDDALVRRLGKDQEYSVRRGGVRYRVVERRYAIFPQHSGQLTIPGPVLDVQVPDERARPQDPLGGMFKDPFFKTPLDDLFTPMRRVRVRGPAKTLRVKPPPAAFAGRQWLPAESLKLQQQWQPDTGPVHVGDAVVRTLVLQARGQGGAQLPDLPPGDVAGFKVYPDKPRSETRDTANGVEGRKTLRVTFIPTRVGRLTLPPLRLHWWDIQAGRERVAELPGRTLEVLPAPGGNATPDTPPTQAAPAPAPVPVAPRQASPVPSAAPSAGHRGRVPWPWISLILALAWLLTLWLLWRRRGGARSPAPGRQTGASAGPSPARTAWRRFETAARAGRAAEARRQLLAWAAARWPENPPRGLDDLARRLDDAAIGEALARLDRVVYREPEADWEGEALVDLLRRLPDRSDPRHRRAPGLPGLYPGQDR